ncbi:AI-2E family transporter [Pedobacter sp. MC2016-14]|uniref:AI-2E family transporter n=1 Tax=Pedobacter sp. MC2016-14 TaxID=2897327 RepID=UPI001E38879A|nr:AI-2E family transporter [Pedobacter sp. MC2016-14]MCD0490610.1 AI-2E family transporter [Pedobacter sp. MC2016-14]
MTKLQRSVHVLLIFFLAIAGLYFAAPVLVPLALAAVFSMLFISLCNFLEHKGMSRGLATAVCIFIFVFTALAIVSLLYWQLGSLTENLDAMKERLSDMFASLRSWIDQKAGITRSQQKEILKQGNSQSGAMLAGFASGILGIAVSTLLVIVYMYLCLYYRSHIKKFILKIVPQNEEERASIIVHESGLVAQKYLGGLAAMIGVLWVMYGIGFSLVGVESAIFFAVLCGTLEIIPFVGNLTGTSVTVLAVIAQGGDSKMIIGVLVVYGIVQFVQTYILEPLIVGEQVNINPLFTILAIVVGETVWGVAGMILAVPMLGIVKIICDRIPELKPYGFLIGPEKQKTKRAGLFSRKK